MPRIDHCQTNNLQWACVLEFRSSSRSVLAKCHVGLPRLAKEKRHKDYRPVPTEHNTQAGNASLHRPLLQAADSSPARAKTTLATAKRRGTAQPCAWMCSACTACMGQRRRDGHIHRHAWLIQYYSGYGLGETSEQRQLFRTSKIALTSRLCCRCRTRYYAPHVALQSNLLIRLLTFGALSFYKIFPFSQEVAFSALYRFSA